MDACVPSHVAECEADEATSRDTSNGNARRIDVELLRAIFVNESQRCETVGHAAGECMIGNKAVSNVDDSNTGFFTDVFADMTLCVEIAETPAAAMVVDVDWPRA